MVKKLCGSCNHSKPTTQFSKYKRAKDGLQTHCKPCQKERTGKILKADRNGIIYRIVNPLSETYIGSTKKKVEYRFSNHRARFKFNQSNPINPQYIIPLLDASFEKWGIDAHSFEVVMDMGVINKKDLRDIESRMIIPLKSNGKSLNVNN